MSRHQYFDGVRPVSALRSLLTIAITVVAAALGAHEHRAPASSAHGVAHWVLSGLFVVVGSFAVRWSAEAVGEAVTRRSVVAAGAIVRFVLSGLGYAVLLIGALALVGVSWQRLLIGAGLISVVLGIAAQQSLANIFASLVLLLGRAFNVGDTIIIRSGTIGTFECEVRAIGLTYVTVRTDEGVMKIPNAVLSAAGIGRRG